MEILVILALISCTVSAGLALTVLCDEISGGPVEARPIREQAAIYRRWQWAWRLAAIAAAMLAVAYLI